MQNVLTIFVTVTLLVIACQDWRSRSVYWFLFPLLAVGGCVMSMAQLGAPGVFFRYLSINLGFLVVQLAALQVYFLLRRPKDSGIIDKKLGLGDLLFLAAAGFFFSPLNFIVFYVGSLVFAVGVALFFRGGGKTGPETARPVGPKTVPLAGLKTVPLAGLQSVFFIVYLFISMISNYSLLNDNWLIRKLGG
jgi:hypothetical protein